MTRGFNTIDGVALVVATVVGAGIFTVPSYVASLGGSPGVILSLWIAGGLMAMAGALCYAELAARFPRGGAEYVYLREAFGPAAGFLSGWTSFIAGFSGAIAAAAVGFERSVVQLVPALSWLPRASVALLLIAAFTVVSILGVRASRIATNALALVIVTGVVGIAVAGLGEPRLPVANAIDTSVTAALSALVPIFFTYSGWNAAAYVAGEFRDPARTVPRALIAGTLIVTALYVGLNASLLGAFPVTSLAASRAPVAEAARGTMGAAGGSVVAVLALAALASSVCAMIVTGPRIYREMARDGVLPAAFARTRGRDDNPVTAILAQSAWSSVLVLTGTFEQIVTYTGFSIMLFSGAAVLALIVLRRRLGAPGGYRVPWYPVLPALFVAVCAAVAIASFRYAPGPSLMGLALIAIGYGLLRLGPSIVRRSGLAETGFVPGSTAGIANGEQGIGESEGEGNRRSIPLPRVARY